MLHEPVDLMFDSWYPTDFLSANLRHKVSAIFSHPAKTTSRQRRLNLSGKAFFLPKAMLFQVIIYFMISVQFCSITKGNRFMKYNALNT